MKTINGKTYQEVIAAESKSGHLSSDRATILGWMANDLIKRFLDRQNIELMSSMNLGKRWDAMKTSPVILYFCEADKSTISPLDLEYTYRIDSKPVTALELIHEAESSCRIDCATTQQAAMALRSIGKVVDNNPNPTKKYE